MKRALLAVVLLFACRESDPIAAAIDGVVDAAEDRDAAEVMSHLAASYKDATGSRAEVEGTLRRYFFAYQAIDVSISNLQTRVNDNEGWASFRVNFTGVPKDIRGIAEMVPRAARYDFQVWLTPEGGDWKIAYARWEQVRE